jgi:hypothetical protein
VTTARTPAARLPTASTSYGMAPLFAFLFDLTLFVQKKREPDLGKDKHLTVIHLYVLTIRATNLVSIYLHYTYGN